MTKRSDSFMKRPILSFERWCSSILLSDSTNLAVLTIRQLSLKLFFMLFIIGMIGISSCTEQDVSTLKSPDAQVELRNTTGPCGDAPNSNNNNVTILSTRTGPNGECCVTIQVNIAFQFGSSLGVSQYVDLGTYTSPATGTPGHSGAAEVLMKFGENIYELCFVVEPGTKYLHIGIVDANGQLVSCSYFPHPCN